MKPAGGTGRSGLLACAAASLSLLAPCAPAADDNSERAFAEAMQHFEAADYERALEHFQAARRAGMATVSVEYNIGVCQYRAGDYAGAAATFRGIAENHPDMRPLAEYNLGLTRVRQNRPDDARAAFETAKAGGDESLARLAELMLARMTSADATDPAAPVRKRWYGYVDFGLGYDDNVALIDDSIGLGETTDSPFAAFFGQLGMSPDLPGDPVFDANLYVVRYPEAQTFDQDVAMLRGWWSLRRSAWRFGIGPQLAWSTLDGDGYERRIGLTFSARRPVSDGHSLELRAVLEDVDEASSRFAFVAGSHRLLGARYRYERDRTRIGVSYEIVFDDRASPEISATRNRLTAGFQRRVDDAWGVGAWVSYRSSRFDELAVTREEDLVEAGLRLTRALGTRWQISGEYRWSDNDSNVDGFDYARNRITFAIDRAF